MNQLSLIHQNNKLQIMKMTSALQPQHLPKPSNRLIKGVMNNYNQHKKRKNQSTINWHQQQQKYPHLRKKNKMNPSFLNNHNHNHHKKIITERSNKSKSSYNHYHKNYKISIMLIVNLHNQKTHNLHQRNCRPQLNRKEKKLISTNPMNK